MAYSLCDLAMRADLEFLRMRRDKLRRCAGQGKVFI